MNLFTGEASDEFFGSDQVPESVRSLLHQAATATADERGPLLWTAHSCAPQCLAVYYALYKHHAGRREFELAEKAALTGLKEAAQQAGLPESPGDVTADMADFSAPGPARFWMFTCKALAFIALRSGRPELSQARLAIIERIDANAGMGSDVISQLLRASKDGDRPPAA